MCYAAMYSTHGTGIHRYVNTWDGMRWSAMGPHAMQPVEMLYVIPCDTPRYATIVCVVQCQMLR
eukprot:4832700-Pyramimonas_sp.AAC.1